MQYYEQYYQWAKLKKTKSMLCNTFVDFGYISYYSHDLLVV